MTDALNTERSMSPPAAPGRQLAPQPRYGWVVLFTVWLAFLMENVCRGAWGAVAHDAQSTFGLSLAALGAFTSASVLGYVIVNIPGGVLADRFGGHRVVPWALLVMAVATAAFGGTSSFRIGLVLQFIAGLGIGFAYASSISLISSWFYPHQRGKAFGLYMTGNSVSIVAVNSVTPVIQSAMNWHVAYYIYGAISALLALVSFILLRPGPFVNLTGRQKLRNVGREAVGLIRQPTILIVLVGALGIPWAAQGFANWAKVLIIEGAGYTPAFAALVVITFGASAIPAKPIFGALSDRWGARRARPLVLVAFVFAVLLVIYGQLDSKPALLLGAVVLGLIAFIPGQLMVTMVTEMVSRNVVGVASGLVNTCAQFGAFLVPLVVGLVFQATDRSIAWSFVALAAGPLFTACVYAFIKERSLEQKTSAALSD